MKALLLFGVGIILWPILEYILHRFSGHTIKFPQEFYLEHQAHHIQKDYFAPAWKKLLVALLVLVALTYMNSLWLGKLEAFIFSSGFIAMYLFYEWHHYAFHAYPPRTKLGLKLRKHHFAHHFVNPRYNHGVTSTIIDRLFKTHLNVDCVPVPKKLAMDWLLDESGSVQDDYRAHFSLR